MYQVRYVVAVASLGGMTRAARSCGVSQPALTTGIKRLEEELGAPLFFRAAGGVSLTDFGRLLLPKFEEIAAQSRGIEQAAVDLRELRSVPIRIGILNTIGPGTIAQALSAFQADAPETEVEVHPGDHDGLLRDLQNATFDFALTNLVGETPSWCVATKFQSEPYRILLPPGHPLAEAEKVALKDLTEEPYIDRLSCEMRYRVEKECEDHDISLYPSYRTSHDEWVESLVNEGIGFAIMPAHSIVQRRSVAKPCQDIALARDISLVRNVEKAATPAARTLWRLLQEHAARA